MREVDEDWATSLRTRAEVVAPEVPVDVKLALRHGRRRRTVRRVAAALPVAGGLAAFTVLGPSFGPLSEVPEGGRVLGTAAVPGDADIREAGPDCFGDEVLQAVGLDRSDAEETGLAGVFEEHPPRPAPQRGAIPRGFEAVAVVQCRVALRYSAIYPVTYEEATLGGDVQAFVEALRLPSGSGAEAHRLPSEGPGDFPPESISCYAMREIKPELYLVDATGRAIRPVLPVDVCDFMRPEVRNSYQALTEGEVVEYRGEFTDHSRAEIDAAVERLQRALDAEAIAWSILEPAPNLDGVVLGVPALYEDPSLEPHVRTVAEEALGGIRFVLNP